MAMETSHFDRKIKTAEEVRRILGARPRRDSGRCSSINPNRRFRHRAGGRGLGSHKQGREEHHGTGFAEGRRVRQRVDPEQPALQATPIGMSAARAIFEIAHVLVGRYQPVSGAKPACHVGHQVTPCGRFDAK